tara:strand:+ start:396 stop:743 length:348 start_codon:yes stop_codon:yes gene_type:complete
MSKVHQMIEIAETTHTGGLTDSSTIFTQQDFDEAGLYQVTLRVGGITNVQFYGRIASNQTWSRIATSGGMTTSTGDSPIAGIGVKTAAIPIYPQMMVRLTSPAANAITADITIME